MSIGGVEGSGGSVQRPNPFSPRAAGDAAARKDVGAASPPAKVAPPAVAAGDADVPVEAPPGTDPALWSVLTAEERRYFAKLQAMGPLTYGPRSTAAARPQVRGGRIDLTV